jgi:hypothetical protein
VGKNPAFQFYPGDWSRDLEEHPLEIEGAWIRICCKLWWSEKRGSLTRSLEQWAKILRTDQINAKRIINYISDQKIGDSNAASNGEITLESRRMLRDDKERKFNMLRQRRFKEKQSGNGEVTPPVTLQSRKSNNALLSSSSSSTSKDLKDILLEHKNVFEQAYPGINLEIETSKAQAWLTSNPKNKKSNLKRFLNNWLSKAQDSINKYPPREDKFL